MSGGEQGHHRDEGSQAAGAGPQEGNQAAWRRHRQVVGVDLDQALENPQHSAPGALVRIHRSDYLHANPQGAAGGSPAHWRWGLVD